MWGDGGHVLHTSVPRLYDVTFWWCLENVLRTCPWQVLDKYFSRIFAVPGHVLKTKQRRFTYVTLFANPHVFVTCKRKRPRHVFQTSNGSLGDVLITCQGRPLQQKHIQGFIAVLDTSLRLNEDVFNPCGRMGATSCIQWHHVCTTSRSDDGLKTS